MKKTLIIALSILFFATAAFAAVYITANQKLVSWDAVKYATDGTTPIPVDQVSYRIYVANALTDPNHANPAKIANNITGTSYLVTLNIEGRYDVGVSAVRTVNGLEINESPITWSNISGVPDPWGIQYFMQIGAPGGFKSN